MLTVLLSLSSPSLQPHSPLMIIVCLAGGGMGGGEGFGGAESEKTGKELEKECCQKLVLSETYKICGICDHESAVQISFLSHAV